MERNKNEHFTVDRVSKGELLLERVQYEQKIEALIQENSILKNQVRGLLHRIEELERKLGQNSKNSHFATAVMDNPCWT